MAQKNNVILPGEFLATEEEYAAGENTYIQDGKILSKTTGRAEFDDINKEVRVKGKQINQIQEGDVVSGKIMMVKESSAMVQLLSAENRKAISGIGVAQLAVRNISNEYIENIKTIIKIGDIIRAHVLMASELAIDISTKEKGFGVTVAYCSNCRKEMQYNNGKMTCIECGNTEKRKWFEAEDNYVPRSGGFEHREGGFDRRGGGGFRGGRRESFGGRDNRRGGFGGRGHSDRRGGFGGRSHDGNRSFGGERSFGEGRRENSFGGREFRPRFDSNRGFGRNNYRNNNESQGSGF